MIYEVDVYKCKDGKMYVRADDEQQVRDYINNTDINEEDVVWDDYSDIDYLPIEENVRPAKQTDKKVPIVDLSPAFDDRQTMFINECKYDDGCGGCPYYENCALAQRGAWF